MITETLTQEELHNAVEHLDLVYNHSSDLMGIGEVKPNGEIHFVSINNTTKKALTRLGKDAQQLIGNINQTMRQVFGLSEQLSDYVTKQCQKILFEKKTISFPIQSTTQDQFKFYFHTILTPVLNSQEEVVKILWTSKDIAKFKMGMDELEEQFTRLSRIYNSTKEMMCYIKVARDYQFLIESVNDRMDSFLRSQDLPSTSSDLIGRNLFDVYKLYSNRLSEENAKSFLNNKLHETLKGQSIKYTERIILKGERIIYLEISFIPIFNRQYHRYTHILNVIREVTDAKLYEIELKAAYKELNMTKKRVEQENEYLKNEMKLIHSFKNLIFSSAELEHVLQKVEVFAPLETPVMIFGETGTGKELIADAIHHLSLRSDKPFIKINCSSMTEEFIERELFGYEKGAFPGAGDRKIGRLELASSGTIFLDEVGELSPDIQFKLLRVLQEGRFNRLGGIKIIELNVRVITATHRDLDQRVEDEKFSEDLFNRLKSNRLEIPALRNRKDDIPTLVAHFAEKYAKKYDKKIEYISDEVFESFKKYSWPGNVRELESLVERAVIVSKDSGLALEELGQVRQMLTDLSFEQ